MSPEELLAAADQVKSIRTNATELGVDPDLAAAVGHQESHYNPAAVSPKGARGTMQVMPKTAEEMAAKYGGDNIRHGVGYLKDMGEQFTDLDETQRRNFTLAAYNAGPKAVERARRKATMRGLDPNDFGAVSQFLPGETQKYVPSIVKRIGTGSGRTQVTGNAPQPEAASPSADDLLAKADALRSKKPPVPGTAEQPETGNTGRGFGEALYDRTVGRVARGVDQALGGLPSTLAGVAGAYSAGDEEGINEALEEGGGTGDRLLGVGSGVLQTGLTAVAPGTSLVQAGVGAGVEALSGDKTAGDVAEIGVGLAKPGYQLATGAVLGARNVAKALTSGPSVEEEVRAGLGAGKTAQEVGHTLQAPKQGARRVISEQAEDNSRLYRGAQEGLKTAGRRVNPKPLARAARTAILDTKAAGGALPSEASQVVRNIRKLGLAKAAKGSKIIDPATGKPFGAGATTGARTSIGADELIEQQSNLRRVIGGLPGNHPARSPLLALDDALEEAIEGSSKGLPNVTKMLGTARKRYRMTTIPTRNTMQKVTRAETPEDATRVLTSAKKPSRFGRFARSAKPDEAEAVRSAYWTDMMAKSRTEEGGLDLMKMATQLKGADAKQLKQMADTDAKRLVLKTIRRVAGVERAARKAPEAGVIAGTMFGSMPGGLGGYAIGRVVRAALTSSTVARAMYRAFQAPVGSAGRKVAISALKKAMEGIAPATRAGVAAVEEDE